METFGEETIVVTRREVKFQTEVNEGTHTLFKGNDRAQN